MKQEKKQSLLNACNEGGKCNDLKDNNKELS